MVKPFVGDRRGAVFVLFSLVLPVILTGVLGLMSFSGLSMVRGDLQSVSDAAANAVLADLNAALVNSATPDAIVSDIDKQARANVVVQSLLGSRSDITNVSTVVTTTAKTISVTVSAQSRNIAGDLFSFPYFKNSATTTISWMRQDQMQVVFSIDSGLSAGKSQSTALRLAILKPILVGAVDILSILPNYPNVGVSIVPFTAQISADPSIVTADASAADHDFLSAIRAQFADATEDLIHWAVPHAHAGVTQCYGDPIVPKGVNGAPFFGTTAPLPQPCESAVTRLRPLVKISRPFVKALPSGSESTNAPERLARDDIKSAINSIAPAGCRNLAMGVSWSMAQLPKDNNPKVIVMIANGNNSQNKRGRTSDCPTGSSKAIVSQAQLDNDFINACSVLRDPTQNKGNILDLFVLQFVEGNSIALRSCASTSDGVTNYFNLSLSTFPGFFRSISDELHRIAKAQYKKRLEYINQNAQSEESDDDNKNENKKSYNSNKS